MLVLCACVLYFQNKSYDFCVLHQPLERNTLVTHVFILSSNNSFSIHDSNDTLFSVQIDHVTTSEWITLYNRSTHSIIGGQKWQMPTGNSIFRCQHEHLSMSIDNNHCEKETALKRVQHENFVSQKAP